MDSLIRWKRTDSERLSRAINRFNREVNALKNEDLYLPDKVNYNELRDHIQTRRELEEVINSLNSANERTLRETQTLASGENISAYEFEEASRKKEIATKNLIYEMNKIQGDRNITGNIYMGEERITEIQSTLEALDKTFESKEDFERMQKRLNFLGRTDYELARNKQFMENFYTALDDISNFENAGLLKKQLRKIRNPNKFYEYVKKSPILMDIFLWYKEDDGSLIYSNFDTNEQAFNSALANDLNLNVDVD